MKRLTVSVVSIVILVLVTVLPAFAGGSSVHWSLPIYIDFEESEHPCGGERVIHPIISGSFDIHDVYDGDGNLVKSTWKGRATLSLTDVATGEVTSGPVVWNFSYAGDAGGPETEIYTARVVEPGPDNNLLLIVVWHASPSGVINPDNVQLNHVCLDKPGS